MVEVRVIEIYVPTTNVSDLMDHLTLIDASYAVENRDFINHHSTP